MNSEQKHKMRLERRERKKHNKGLKKKRIRRSKREVRYDLARKELSHEILGTIGTLLKALCARTANATATQVIF